MLSGIRVVGCLLFLLAGGAGVVGSLFGGGIVALVMGGSIAVIGLMMAMVTRVS